MPPRLCLDLDQEHAQFRIPCFGRLGIVNRLILNDAEPPSAIIDSTVY